MILWWTAFFWKIHVSIPETRESAFPSRNMELFQKNRDYEPVDVDEIEEAIYESE